MQSRRATYPSASHSFDTASSTSLDLPVELFECRQALRNLWLPTSPLLLPTTPVQQTTFPALRSSQSKSQQDSVQQQFIDLPERAVRVALRELRCCLARDLAPLLEEPRLASRIWRRQFGTDCCVANGNDMAPASVKIAVTPDTPPEPGDIVELRYYRLPHLVVAESVERNPATGQPRLLRAIHFGRPSLFGGIRVLRDDFRLDGGGVAIRRYPASACRPAGETVDRARSCLGHAGHSMLGNNAGQFARWCKLHSAGSAVQRFASLTVFEEHSELRAGDHINWPTSATAADGSESSARSVHAEVRAVGRRHNLLALRLMVLSVEVNAAKLEFAHRRTVTAYPAAYPALRHRLTSSPTPALPLERVERRAAAFLGAVFQAGTVSPLSFAATLAAARDPLEALVLADSVGGAGSVGTNSSYGVDSVPLSDLRVGDVVSIDGQPPGLLTELQRVEPSDGCSGALITAALLIYGHAPQNVDRDPVCEFRCFVDTRRTSFHQRIRVSLQHADFDCPLAAACAKHADGYTVRRVVTADELQPGCSVSYRRHVSDIGVDDFDENDYDDDDDCHRLTFRHAVVASCQSTGGDRRKAEVGLIYFSAAMGWVRRICRVFDLTRDEVFRIEYTSGRPRSLEESLARAERRLDGGGGAAAVDELEDAEAWQLGAKYDLRTNNGRQFARWCRQRDDFELDSNSTADPDVGGIEWLEAWQSRLSVRQLPESRQPLRYCLHRCLQAISEFSDSSPLSAVCPLVTACLLICSAADSNTTVPAANQRQQLVRRALCPGFFSVLSASVAASAAGQVEDEAASDNVGENNSNSDWFDGGDKSENFGDVQAFLVCLAASLSGAALECGIDGRGGGCGGGVGFSKQLADLRRFFRP
ncbi:hypothetical protein BOX15_Mlig014099g2 [Macrostomum lignano]|uniref:Uncharacterized protein n=1 Tax=Macrostomum lignano TaxID=282301 RepID=A0A267FNK5_9PLAT|nr:hypothetical protein BOX15_Mlig014099g2 [Macrostomum lignano]